jgi:hypothetical protein
VVPGRLLRSPVINRDAVAGIVVLALALIVSLSAYLPHSRYEALNRISIRISPAVHSAPRGAGDAAPGKPVSTTGRGAGSSRRLGSEAITADRSTVDSRHATDAIAELGSSIAAGIASVASRSAATVRVAALEGVAIGFPERPDSTAPFSVAPHWLSAAKRATDTAGGLGHDLRALLSFAGSRSVDAHGKLDHPHAGHLSYVSSNPLVRPD